MLYKSKIIATLYSTEYKANISLKQKAKAKQVSISILKEYKVVKLILAI